MPSLFSSEVFKVLTQHDHCRLAKSRVDGSRRILSLLGEQGVCRKGIPIQRSDRVVVSVASSRRVCTRKHLREVWGRFGSGLDNGECAEVDFASNVAALLSSHPSRSRICISYSWTFSSIFVNLVIVCSFAKPGFCMSQDVESFNTISEISSSAFRYASSR
jgi:hypothetical protein